MGLSEQLDTAEAAIRHAQDVRMYHRRRTDKGSKQRQRDLNAAATRIKKAMKPLRSYLGKASFDPLTPSEELNKVSATSKRLQSERRKIWKMQQRKNGR